MRHFSVWFFCVWMFVFGDFASAKEVVIVTSFPKELFETYKKTFEAKHPGIKVIINSKQTPGLLICAKPRRDLKRIFFGSALPMLSRPWSPTVY